MKMKSFLLISAISLISLNGAGPSSGQSADNNSVRRVVTAAQINGVYKYGRNDFRVLALGHNKIKVQFNGEWMTRGGYPNIGEAIGEATIVGNVATFIPGDTTKCKITMTFLTNKMIVQQEGFDADCGFGHNVMATGTYRRVKAGRPKWIPIPQ
jgi:hypothetical protein